MQELSGKAAFVTGGASGIGLGMAKAFAEQCISVAIADVRQDHIERARRELEGSGAFHFINLDVTDRAAFARAADEAEAAIGPVSILCNNAGVGMLGDAKSTGYVDWDWVMGVNLGGVINGIQSFLPRMLASGVEGHIVNTSSIGGMLPMPGGAAYITSKAAVIGLSEALYSDLRSDGIGVTVLIPGPTASNIHEVAKLRPTGFAETGLAELEAELAKGPLFPGGLAPLETGRMVVKAIAGDQLYLFTHADFRHGVAQRFAAIMTGFGKDGGDLGAADSYGFPAFNQHFSDIVSASNNENI